MNGETENHTVTGVINNRLLITINSVEKIVESYEQQNVLKVNR